jgi:hypothetical protein
MALAKIFMAFVAAIAALAVVAIIIKVGYKILNRTFARTPHEDVMEKLHRKPAPRSR